MSLTVQISRGGFIYRSCLCSEERVLDSLVDGGWDNVFIEVAIYWGSLFIYTNKWSYLLYSLVISIYTVNSQYSI